MPPTAKEIRDRPIKQHAAIELACEGCTMAQIAERLDITPKRIATWIEDDIDGFGQKWRRANRIRSMIWSESRRDIADRALEKVETTNEDGSVTIILQPTNQSVRHADLRINTINYMLPQMHPKAFGEKREDDGYEELDRPIQIVFPGGEDHTPALPNEGDSTGGGADEGDG